MRMRVVACLAIAAGALFGCGDKADKKAPDGGKAVPNKVEPGLAAYSGPCQLGGTPAKVCSSVVVYRTATPHVAAVDPNTLEMPPGEKNLRLYWQLPSDCVFDTDQGDGVMLKDGVADPENQFSDKFATEDNGHGAPGGGGPQAATKGHRFHWRNKNDGTPKSYDYAVRFRCGSDTTPWIADPTIKNQ